MNHWERKVKADLEAEGYEILRNGEPDLWLVKGGKIVGWREVKGPADWVRPHQALMHKILENTGIPGEVVKFNIPTSLERRGLKPREKRLRKIPRTPRVWNFPASEMVHVKNGPYSPPYPVFSYSWRD